MRSQFLSRAGNRLRAVDALRRERDRLTAASAVRDAGVAEVKQVANGAAGEIRRAAAEFERIQTHAVGLAKHVRMAQALAHDHAAMWQRVEPETWAGLLAHLLRWAEARLDAFIRVHGTGRCRYPSLP